MSTVIKIESHHTEALEELAKDPNFIKLQEALRERENDCND